MRGCFELKAIGEMQEFRVLRILLAELLEELISYGRRNAHLSCWGCKVTGEFFLLRLQLGPVIHKSSVIDTECHSVRAPPFGLQTPSL